MLIEISLVAFFYIPNLCGLCEEWCSHVGGIELQDKEVVLSLV